MNTEDVIVNLQAGSRIILNCSYQNDSKEDIANRYIIWQKQIGSSFKDVAYFSPPGGATPSFHKEMENLYKNRTELIGPNTSLSAVMIIKDPVCTDEGTYKCWIEYFDEESTKLEKNVSSVVVFNSKYIPLTKYGLFGIYQSHSIIHLMEVYEK